MNTLYRNYRTLTVAAMAAIVVVGLTGLTLDRGHAGALPRGVVEIGELQTLQVGNLAVAVLPEVQVIGSRDVQLADVDSIEADGTRG
jgi:hypothetical protein